MHSRNSVLEHCYGITIILFQYCSSTCSHIVFGPSTVYSIILNGFGGFSVGGVVSLISRIAWQEELVSSG